MRVRRSALCVLTSLVGMLLVASPSSAVAAPTVAAINSFTVVQGTTGPVGDITVTEASAGQLLVGDKVTFRFADSASAATVHFGTAGSVGGSNGLAATVKITSSSGSLLDQMEVTIASASSGAFPGVLTLSGLTPAFDAGAATGALKVTVTDTGGLLTGVLTSDGAVITSGTAKAGYSAQTNPTILSTGTTQQASNVVITEPAKIFFKTGDIITLTLRDNNGSTDTVGLAATPSAGGGSMQVSVHGATTDTVQNNDTSFKVKVDAQDPSNGSTSSITITNLLVNTAQAPLGSVTLTAALTTGAATEYIVPGRVVVAGVGGNTTTSSAGTPSLAVNTTGQLAANVTVSAAAGSLLNGDTVSLTIQEPGVTFTASASPQATVTNGDLVLTNSVAVLDGTHKTATWTVKTGNARSTTMVVGPVSYDVAGGATPGDAVTLLAAGNAASAFNSQNVDNAVIAGTHAVGRFTTLTSDLTPLAGSPWNGAPVHFAEATPGALPVGSSLVLVTPYATQIAAYRTTYAAVPNAAVTGDLVLGAPTVNSSAAVVQTASGPITAPAQTLVTFPVTHASTSASSVTVSGIVYTFGSYVPPGALVGTGAVVAAGGGSATDGEQYVDLSSSRGLGTTSSTAAPVVTFTSYPPETTNSTQATFAWISDPTGADFSCTIDGLNFGACVSPLTLTGLSSTTHTFAVTPTLDNQTGYPTAYTWTVDNTPPTASTNASTPVVGPLVVNFSERVLGVSSATVVWTDAATLVAVPGAVTCKNGTTTVACNSSAGVTTALFTPSGALVPGANYKVTVPSNGGSISDLAGAPMVPATLTTRASISEQESSAAAVVNWRKVTTSSASGGSYGLSHKAGARSSLTFTGTAVAWYSVKGPSMGTANVYLDGTLKKTVNLYRSSTLYNVVGYSVSGLTSAKHTVSVLVNGAKGSSAGTDTAVAVDRFVFGATTVQQDGTGVVTSWRRVTASSASGGAYSYDDLAGAMHVMPFRGASVTWYAVSGPGMGKAAVYIDGTLKATVDLFSSSTSYGKLAYKITGLSAALHSIKIVVLGQHRSGSSGNAVTIDRFLLT